ncbi:Tumor protein [Trichinella spiralis]|uniref:Tumor protein n=1 Tax=Trichinella spiralis TaxID=6334 RepID=A0ABR3KCR5_TRISP
MPCIGDRPNVTVTPGVTNGDEDGMRQSTAVTPVDDHSTSFCRTPPPFPGNGDLKIWLMRLVDYFQENTIPEEKRYGFTKLLFSDEGYGMVIAAGFGRHCCYQALVDYLHWQSALKQTT